MKRGWAILLIAAMLLPGGVAAQSSMFGTRVLGLPLLPLSARSQGMGGGNAQFDPEVGLNPASFWITQRHVGMISARHYWRDSENPFGTSTGNDTQIPLVLVSGPIGRKWDYGLTVAGFTDRTFALALTDTLTLRGQEVAVNDTLLSKGGTTDIGASVSYTLSQRLAIGVGLHMLTGTNRIEYRRQFADSSYLPVRIRNELSVSGPGLTFGLSAQPVKNVRLAGMVRFDTDLNYYKDSIRVGGDIPMPMTYAGGVLLQPSPRFLLAGQALHRNWSVMNDFVISQGGVGARNTTEGSLGFEFARDRTRPTKFPLRLGVRYAQLPFPAVAGQEGREFQLSLGTGFRFTGERGSLDFAVERTWRDDSENFKERTFMISFGIGIRP